MENWHKEIWISDVEDKTRLLKRRSKEKRETNVKFKVSTNKKKNSTF